MRYFFTAILLASAWASPGADEAITRIWLTHETTDVSSLTINWESPAKGPSRVEYGPSASLGSASSDDEASTRHHVAIPFPASGTLHYRVSTGEQQSAIHAVKTYSGDSLRIAATSNWYLQPPLDGIVADDPHLLISGGDLVPGVFEEPGSSGAPNTAPFSDLIDRYPDLFARTPFLAAPGNHDRQIRVNTKRDAGNAPYDLEARAFRAFFPLPGDGRFYHVDIPSFDVRIAALDVSHIRDIGTPRQSCPDLGLRSEQFRWYRELVGSRSQRFMITCYNEHSGALRSHDRGNWERLLRQNSLLFSGFGSFAELTEVKGTPYANAALKSNPAYRAREHVVFFEPVESYALLRVPATGERMTLELKQIDGTLLHTSSWGSRATPGNRR